MSGSREYREAFEDFDIGWHAGRAVAIGCHLLLVATYGCHLDSREEPLYKNKKAVPFSLP